MDLGKMLYVDTSSISFVIISNVVYTSAFIHVRLVFIYTIIFTRYFIVTNLNSMIVNGPQRTTYSSIIIVQK